MILDFLGLYPDAKRNISGSLFQIFRKLAVAALFLSCCAWSQGLIGSRVSVGVKGGVPLTESLTDTTWPASFPGAASRTFSESKNFIIGPILEVHLPLGLSIEGDGLYRSVNIAAQFDRDLASFLLGRFIGISSVDYAFWEVSALAKYHLPLPFVKPYMVAGPSFRTVDG